MLAAQRALQFGVEFVDRDRGEEAEAAQIHREQRDLAPPDGARRGEQRAVAAQHDHQVAAFRHLLARQSRDAAGVDGGLFVDADRDAALLQPLDQLGTPAAPAAGEFGLETMPTVLMTGIEEKFLVPFGAGIGLSMMSVSNPNSRTAPFTRSQAAWCSCGIANDAALAHLALAHFKCGLISITICPPGCSKRDDRRQDQGHGNEADIAAQQVRPARRCLRTASSRALMPSCSTTRGSVRSFQSSCPAPHIHGVHARRAGLQQARR